MRTDRLTKLAELLGTVPEKRFNMNYWGWHDSGVEAPEMLDISECGTSACALGWACSIPEFREAGLTLEKTGGGFYPRYFPHFTTTSMTVPVGKVTYTGYAAAEKFFDITANEAEWLFSPDTYMPEDADPEEWDTNEIKPADVAERIHALLRGEGPQEEDDNAD